MDWDGTNSGVRGAEAMAAERQGIGAELTYRPIGRTGA